MTSVPIWDTIVPIMGSFDASGLVASALFGKTRRAVLALLFCQNERSYYLREISRLAGVGRGALQRELERLVQAGLVTRSRRGNLVLFQANRDTPVFAELRGLMVKTAGVADVLRRALSSLADRIVVAFVYGSMARGEETAESDVDVMVIGEAGFREVCATLSEAEEELGREVNPTVYSADEARKKMAEGQHFVSAVLREPKVFLIGDEDELGRLAQ